MAEAVDRKTEVIKPGAAMVLVPALLAWAAVTGAGELAGWLHAQRAAFGLIGGVILEPLAWLLEGFGWALALVFAAATALAARALAQAGLGLDDPVQWRRAAWLQLQALDAAHASLGPAVLVVIAAALARILVDPAVAPEVFLLLLLGLLTLLAAPLLWAGREPIRPHASGLKRGLGRIARVFALAAAPGGGAGREGLARHLPQLALLALVLLATLAAALRERPRAWAWMPALEAGQAGQIDPAAYADRRQHLARAPLTPFVQSLVVRGDHLEIFYPFDPLYHPYAMAQRCPDLPARAEPGMDGERYWRGQLLACINRLHVIRLNGSTLSGAEWQVSLDPRSGQRGYRALLPISGIEAGAHRLDIERPAPGTGEVIETDQAPYSIPFWRE